MHGRLSQKSIGEHLLKSGGNITVLVDHLEREGLVERERCTEDRRVIYVSLTKQGEELFDNIYPEHLDRIREVMGSLDSQQCEDLIGLLNVVLPYELNVICNTRSPQLAN
jgi:MarR family 2-MHQ and catechol resistance regulon transcriptional repressor